MPFSSHAWKANIIKCLTQNILRATLLRTHIRACVCAVYVCGCRRIRLCTSASRGEEFSSPVLARGPPPFSLSPLVRDSCTCTTSVCVCTRTLQLRKTKDSTLAGLCVQVPCARSRTLLVSRLFLSLPLSLLRVQPPTHARARV